MTKDWKLTGSIQDSWVLAHWFLPWWPCCTAVYQRLAPGRFNLFSTWIHIYHNAGAAFSEVKRVWEWTAASISNSLSLASGWRGSLPAGHVNFPWMLTLLSNLSCLNYSVNFWSVCLTFWLIINSWLVLVFSPEFHIHRLDSFWAEI